MRLDCYAVCMCVICWCYVMLCYVLRSWHLSSIVSDPRKLPTEPIPSCRHAVLWPLCVALNLGRILYWIFMNLQQSSSRDCDKAFAGMKADFMSFLLTIDWCCYGSDILRYNLDTQWPLYMWWWLRRCFSSDWLTDRWSRPAEAAASSLRARLNWTTHLLCHLHHISKSGWYSSPKNIHICKCNILY